MTEGEGGLQGRGSRWLGVAEQLGAVRILEEGLTATEGQRAS